MKRFNSRLFIVLSIIIAGVAFVSCSEAFARDEGRLGTGAVRNFLADMFNVMRFPTLMLFKKLTRRPLYFSLGMLVNALMYSLAVERTLYLITRPKEEEEDVIEFPEE